MPQKHRAGGGFGDALLTSVVNEQLSMLRTKDRERLFYLSSGENELPPPPLYRDFFRLDYDKTLLLQRYTNGDGYPPLVRMIEEYETFRAGKKYAAKIKKTHAAAVTVGAAGAIYLTLRYLGERAPPNVLLIDYMYPIFERVVRSLGGSIKQVLPDNPGEPVLPELAAAAILKNKPNIIVICNTSNPTGQSYTRRFLHTIFSTARKLGAWVIYDRVCEFDIGTDKEVDCIQAAIDCGAANRLVIINSISKTCALPGLRMGWAYCPKPLAKYIGLSQFYSSENPQMAGVTPLIVDLWLRTRNIAESQPQDLSFPEESSLKHIYDTNGLIRDTATRRMFDGLFSQGKLDPTYGIHVKHFESQLRVFHSNFNTFKAVLGKKLKTYPQSMKGYNIMVSRADFESFDPLGITHRLLKEASISIVPEACFVSCESSMNDHMPHFRLSLGTKPKAFKEACARFAGWFPD